MKKVDAEPSRVYRREMWRIAQPNPSLILLIFAALLAVSSSIQVRGARAQATNPPPVSSPSFGPQRTITCPAGAIDIRPGSSIQNIVNAYPGPTTFCLRAGVHSISASITPRSGNTFIGEYGAILDGTGWTTSDLTQAAFRAHSEDINDVTIRNVVIRHMPQRGIHAYSSGTCDVAVHVCKFSTAGADRWTIENNEIAYNVEGVNVPTDGIIRHNYIHHNIGPDPFGTNGRTRGGGFESFLAQRVLFEHNEISYNGQEMKAASLSPNTTFRNNFVHHNLGNGIWFDGENPGSLIENNIVEDNPGQGIFYEVSGQGVIRNNTVRRSGGNGIFIATSHQVEIYGNTLEDNFRGINYFVDCSAVGAPSGGEIGEEVYMQNVSAHDNTITVSSRMGAWASALSYTACTPTQLAPYLNGSKNLTFTNNVYLVPDVSTGWWVWGDSLSTWIQWQALGRDLYGVITRHLREQ